MGKRLKIKRFLSQKRGKRIVAYRILSIISEFIIIWLFTGSLIIPSIVAIACVVVHTGLHYLVESIWRD